MPISREAFKPRVKPTYQELARHVVAGKTLRDYIRGGIAPHLMDDGTTMLVPRKDLQDWANRLDQYTAAEQELMLRIAYGR